jgi:hypothetical protein
MNENSKAMDQLMVFPNGGSVIHDDIVDALAYVGMCCQAVGVFMTCVGETHEDNRGVGMNAYDGDWPDDD